MGLGADPLGVALGAVAGVGVVGGLDALVGGGQLGGLLPAQASGAGLVVVVGPHRAQDLHLRQVVHPAGHRVGVDLVQQRTAVRADLLGQAHCGGVLAFQQPGGLHLAPVALVPARRKQRHQPGRMGPGDLLQRGPQALPDLLDPVQPAHTGEHVRGIRALTSTRAHQPGRLQPFQHHAQQPIRPAADSQPIPELAQHRGVQPHIVQHQPQQVLPRDPVRDRLRSLPVRQVVHELQDRHHQQQRRREPWLPKRRVHPLELAGQEVLVPEQHPQRVPHPHLISPPRMHLPRQLRRGRRNLRRTPRTQHHRHPSHLKHHHPYRTAPTLPQTPPDFASRV